MSGQEGKPGVNELPPATAEQIRRANVLLELAGATEDADREFILCVGALHLARAIPAHYYTLIEDIPFELKIQGEERNAVLSDLKQKAEEIFSGARRYDLLTQLREWDFHRAPLENPQLYGPNGTIGHGAPLRLSTGPNKNSSVAYLSGNRLLTTGSGRRLGRHSYYQIQQSRYRDFEGNEAVPLALAIREFLEDMPRCVAAVLQLPKVIEYLKARE